MRFHPAFFLLLGLLTGCATRPVKNYTFATAPRVIDYPAYVYRAGTEKAFVSSPADGQKAGASAVVDGRQLVFPAVLFRVPPRYPIAMKVRGIGGEVLVEFTVQPDGSVADAHPVKATDDAFVAPAIACIRQWRFRPGTVDGRLVHWARVQQAFTFFLD